MSSTIPYRPEIDGLRCWAVLAVIVFHTIKPIMPGGYLGVDIFFVISGYLITSIMLHEISTGTFSLAKFWDRRIKRILPAASAVLLLTSLTQALVVFRPDLEQLLTQKLAAMLSFANIYLWKNAGDYWGIAAEESPFLHYWSLSVEEQYYFFYPIVIVALIKVFRKDITLFLLGLTFVSLVLFAYGAITYPTATFYLLPTRMWQLGAGCILAARGHQTPFKNSSAGTLTGILLFTFACLFPFNSTGIGFESFIAVVAASLMIGSGSNRVSSIFLENPAVIFIGKISYSLYLWHWPIIVSLKKLKSYHPELSSPLLFAIGSFILVFLSLFSFSFIERPFRKSKNGTAWAVALALFSGIYFLVFEPYLLRKTYPSNYQQPTWFNRYYDLRPNPPEFSKTITSNVNAPPRSAPKDSYKNGGIIRQRASQYPQVVLLGDSHASMVAKVIEDVTQDLDLTVSLWSVNGEPPFLPPSDSVSPGRFFTRQQRIDYDESRMSHIQQWHPDIVIVAARWEIYADQAPQRLIQFLQAHAKRILILESPPALKEVGNRVFYQYSSFLGDQGPQTEHEDHLWPFFDLQKVIRTREHLISVALDAPKISFLPTADLFLRKSALWVGSGSRVFYFDDDHLTHEGSQLLIPRIKTAIQNILKDDLNSFPLVTSNGDEILKTLQATQLPQIQP